MTEEEAFQELLRLVSAGRHDPFFLTESDLKELPENLLTALKSSNILTPAPPAKSVVCPGCEESCQMPVEIRYREDRTWAAFVNCDKRNDIASVQIPSTLIEQWMLSIQSLANFIAHELKLSTPQVSPNSKDEITLGLIKIGKHRGYISILIENETKIKIAGHQIQLGQFLYFKKNAMKVDFSLMNKLLANSITGAGDQQSSAQRYARLKKRVEEEKLKGTRGFLKIVSAEEGIGVSRLKQIIYDKKIKSNSRSSW